MLSESAAAIEDPDVEWRKAGRRKPQKQKDQTRRLGLFVQFNAGDHLISHKVALAVPSAQRGLTSVFEMGTGDPSQYCHRQT